MASQVMLELEQIPTGPGYQQTILRMVFKAMRHRSLGKNSPGAKSRGQVLQEAIKVMRVH